MLKIREPKLKDINDLVENTLSYYKEVKDNPELGLDFQKKLPSRTEVRKWHTDAINKFKEGKSVFLVAEEDGKVVGKCDIEPQLSNSEVEHVGSLSASILKEYRGKGIGTRLLNCRVTQHLS